MPERVDPKANRDREDYLSDADYEPTPIGDFRSGRGSPEHLENLRKKLEKINALKQKGVDIYDDEFIKTQAEIDALREKLYGNSNPDSHGTD